MRTVSVHIVTYNSSNDIEACLDAILSQNYPLEKIVLIDNASSDDTFQRIEKYYPRISFVQNKINTGFAGAHNQAINLTNTDFILVLNPDVTLDPDYVRVLVEEMNRDSSVGSATGKLLRSSDPNIVDSTGLVITKNRRTFDRGSGETANRWNESSEAFGVSGAAAMYARRMVADLLIDGQFFDESFFAYKEDVDVAWRAQLFGWKAIYVPEAVAHHGRGWKADNRSTKSRKIRKHSYINRCRMIIKNDRVTDLMHHFIPILKYEILATAYAILKEPFLFSAWLTLIKDLPDLWKARKKIQSRAKKSPYTWFQ